jgi:hypothetical protein
MAFADRTLRRINPASGVIEASLAIPGVTSNFPWSPAADDTGVWVVANGADARIVHVNAADNRIDRELALSGPLPRSMAYGAGSLWLNYADNLVVRADPSDGRELARIQATDGFSLEVTFVDASGAWGVSTRRTGTPQQAVSRIDTTDNVLTDRIVVANSLGNRCGTTSLAAGGGSLWVATADAAAARIDPVTRTLVSRYANASSCGIGWANGHVWFSATTTNQLIRFNPGD